jgi:ADP-heptose:LPS heptosyltransferase
MRLGFDLDSVLCNSDITMLRMIDQMTPEQREAIEEWYYLDREPKLNPEDFISDEDEYVIITGRSEKMRDVTVDWVEKYCANCLQLFIVDLGPAYNCTTKQVANWSKEQAKRKAKIINQEKVEVYFEDNSECVKELRKLCPKCKVVQFGGKLY